MFSLRDLFQFRVHREARGSEVRRELLSQANAQRLLVSRTESEHARQLSGKHLSLLEAKSRGLLGAIDRARRELNGEKFASVPGEPFLTNASTVRLRCFRSRCSSSSHFQPPFSVHDHNSDCSPLYSRSLLTTAALLPTAAVGLRQHLAIQ